MIVSYQSTRGEAKEASFRAVTMGGLAEDGGLYIPKAWPQFPAGDITAMQGRPYLEIAEKILLPFVAPHVTQDQLRKLLKEAYGGFDDPAIAPLRPLDDGHWLLELFHGPTLAFKDLALQFLGQVFDFFLAHSGERMTVIGATSGDTGSAAIAALAGRRNIDVFILYPQKGPSEIQRKQMTCVDAPNIFAIGIEGSFDDCQAIVKALFNNAALRARYNFAAINSINWLRILGQIVYYFAAAASFGGKPVSFVVPTGNFGNIYAGYAALQCGLPVSKLATASNQNDILPRFFATGRMRAEPVKSTLSPSMDIQISSNFERLLFDLCGGNSGQVRDYMSRLTRDGEFQVSKMQLAMARQVFTAASAGDELTLRTIRDVYEKSGVMIDPHTAVGAAAARILARELPEPVIVLATAHAAKFPDVIKRATGKTPDLPPGIATLLQKPERLHLIPAKLDAVEKFIAGRATA